MPLAKVSCQDPKDELGGGGTWSSSFVLHNVVTLTRPWLLIMFRGWPMGGYA